MNRNNHAKTLKQYAHHASVLVIDDDKEFTSSLKKILVMFFGEVVIADNGQKGLEIFEKRHEQGDDFALVLCEIALPSFEGLSFVEELRKIHSKIPIIVLSTHEKVSALSGGMSTLVESYLFKPLQVDRFLRTVTKVMVRRVTALSRSVKADSDELTGFPTGISLELYLSTMERSDETLLKMRVDHFYRIREVVGISYANRYIKELSLMLARYFSYQEGITIYRIGADEFALVVKKNTHQVLLLAENLLATGRYFYISDDGIVLNSTITVGVANGFGKELLVHADVALRKALLKPGSICTYEASVHGNEDSYVMTHQTLRLINEAIEEGGVIPFYQPILECSTQKIVKYECLVRIQKDDQIFTPMAFLDVALNANQILSITRLMIRKSFEYLSTLEDKQMMFSINLSTEDLQDETIINYITYWLNKLELNPQRIIFEILENVNIYTCPTVHDTINKIKALGCGIAVDDFGTGYSNFIHLIALRPDFIKIDGSFVQRLLTDSEFETIFLRIVQLIHLCGAKCIAEYASNEFLVQKLQELGVDFIQGYAIGEPKKALL